jgi:peptidoglycan LD-endopeptidase LytH
VTGAAAAALLEMASVRGTNGRRGVHVRRTIGDLAHRLLAATVVVAMAGGAFAVSGLQPPVAAAAPGAETPDGTTPPAPADAAPEEPETSAEELAYERALEALTAARRELQVASSLYQAAIGASNRADGALRGGEEAIVADVLRHLEVEEAIEQARQRLRAAERRVRRIEARLSALVERSAGIEDDVEVARLQLEERVIRAYKTGSLAYESTLPLTLVREATSPSELATAIKQLSTLMAVGLDEVEELVEELAALDDAIREARTERRRAIDEREAAVDALDAAEEERERTEVAVTGREARAVTLRDAAYVAEARLLAAVDTVQRKRQALVEAREEAFEAAERAGVAASKLETAGDGSDDPADDLEATAWGKRATALARARSLPTTDRRVAADWVCPVPDGRFINDWGFPRTDNRRHEGTDVFAPIGTPVLAPTDSVVADLDPVDRFDGRRDLGGITMSLEHDRHRYYLAHLDAIAPELQVGDEVTAGTVVGWVGRTGNARGTPPHLHLGWYVDRIAVNPYATLAVACSSQRPPLRTTPDGSPAADGARGPA